MIVFLSQCFPNMFPVTRTKYAVEIAIILRNANHHMKENKIKLYDIYMFKEIHHNVVLPLFQHTDIQIKCITLSVRNAIPNKQRNILEKKNCPSNSTSK